MGYWNNKGQEDGSRGVYDPPHGLLDDLMTWTSDGMENNAKDNSEYDAGYANAQNNR